MLFLGSTFRLGDMVGARAAPSCVPVFCKDLNGVTNMIIAPPGPKLDGIFSITFPHVIYSDFCAATAKAKWVSLMQRISV